MEPNNPFLIAGYHSPAYFCDRLKETAALSGALYNGRNLTLMAPRRMGKTGLIKNAFYYLKKEHPEISTFYMDIFPTTNLHDFTQLFANTILEESTLKEIFDYLKSSEKRCYIAIDEFQQIAEYPEKGVEALLRSYIQFLPNVNFVFGGSKQHIMQDMFLSAKRPFYQSTQILAIGSIDKQEYYKFASGFFSGQKMLLGEEAFSYIYNGFEGHTWYIQAILNRLYSYRKSPDIALVNRAIEEIIDESVYAYESLLSAYTTANINLLRAIAKEGCVREINSGDFISKHRLKAASSINSSLKKLIDKELVYKSKDGYIVYDRFMSIWLRQLEY